MPPAPNPHARQPNALRGGARGGATRINLPAGGRKGDTPEWPLALARDEETAEREASLWVEVWMSPQAVAWERLRVIREVAMYVRWSVKAESCDRDAASEARQLADRLGLNPKAMRALAWDVPADEVGEQRADRNARVSTPRARPKGIRAVDKPAG
jgi:hypothetical protein